MQTPLISIIVPCYKQAHFLNEALQSVINQTYSSWECIIVNDGSPDDTEEVAVRWLEKDERFVYVHKKNGGLSSARNAGIKKSRGVYILPLDADDLLAATYLEKQVAVLERNTSLGIVTSYSNFFYKEKNNIIYQLKPIGDNVISLLFVNQLVATSLYRKECWTAVSGYDETMKKGFEDWDFWISITKLGWTYSITREFLFYYRKAQQSMLANTIEHHSDEVKRYIFTKHKELYIQNFDNCMEVLFFEMEVQRKGHNKFKNSLEYKIGKLILKPYRWVSQFFSSPKKEL
ncbi:glycosyl transferase family 2 [Flavobacterium faecale]|uniref:Glycosyl transferase family 2 n=1 Tax=Flavobacterium faecale TaxID=1355330 RepID=A0A2S1LCH5_9FLAO|nr:glycosyltransferase family A protein [Flavobacterium faecale]AWG21455.1 glycosyl transferase family 2 [Flavobacterium faecale]